MTPIPTIEISALSPPSAPPPHSSRNWCAYCGCVRRATCRCRPSSMFSVGVFLWLLYGFYIGSKPVIASNGVTLLLSVSILILKLRYGRGAKEEMEP